MPFSNVEANWLETSTDDIAGIVREVITSTNSSHTLLETGFLTFRALTPEGLVNEVCLTVTNAASRETATRTAEDFLRTADVAAELIQLLNAGTTWLFRFRVLPQSL